MKQLQMAPAIALGLSLALSMGCQPKAPNEATPPTGSSTQIQSVPPLAHVATGKSPHGIVYANDHVYVCNVGGDALTVLDAAGNKQADLKVQQGPTYATSEGSQVLVANGASGSISMFGADQVVTNLEAVGSKPDKVHVTEDGRYAYVTLVGENAIAKIDLTASPPAVSKITVGPAEGHRSLIVLNDMVIAPDSAANTVQLVDRTSNAATAVTVGTKPMAIAVGTYEANGSPQRVLVVGNGGSNTASFIDLATKQVVKTLDVGITPNDAVAVGKYVYLTNSGSNTVSVLDVEGRSIVATLPVGSKPVHAFAPPAGGGGPASQVWIGNDGDSFVSILDASTRTVYAKVECQGGHHKMAFSPDGKKAFITNLASNSVSVIDRTSIR